MDIENLRDRINSETDIGELLGNEYLISKAKNTDSTTPKEQKHLKVIERETGLKIKYNPIKSNSSDKRSDGNEAFIKVEFIVPKNSNKGDWFRDQVKFELLNLPYINREISMDTEVGDEYIVYTGIYAVSTHWIE